MQYREINNRNMRRLSSFVEPGPLAALATCLAVAVISCHAGTPSEREETTEASQPEVTEILDSLMLLDYPAGLPEARHALQRLEEIQGRAGYRDGVLRLATILTTRGQEKTAVMLLLDSVDQVDRTGGLILSLGAAAFRDKALCSRALEVVSTMEFSDLGDGLAGRMGRYRLNLACGTPTAQQGDLLWLANKRAEMAFGENGAHLLPFVEEFLAANFAFLNQMPDVGEDHTVRSIDLLCRLKDGIAKVLHAEAVERDQPPWSGLGLDAIGVITAVTRLRDTSSLDTVARECLRRIVDEVRAKSPFYAESGHKNEIEAILVEAERLVTPEKAASSLSERTISR